jgi:arginyl-tRNA synthetase
VKKYLKKIIINSIKKLNLPVKEFVIDQPKDSKFGDLSANIALVLSKELNQKPRDIAKSIIDNLEFESDKIDKTEIAGPGFINFYISDNHYRNELLNILDDKYLEKNLYINSGKTANVEWVSANPTGPLHAGHGRQVCLGKAIANLLEYTGYEVTREYYYNDAGNQMNNLAKSIRARYEQIFNPEFPFPDEGYVGEYIIEIARNIYNEFKDKFRNSDDSDFIKNYGEKENFNRIINTLGIFGIKHDIFFNETSLYKNKNINKLVNIFKEKNLAYEKDGAIWLKMDEKFEKDKVIVKATGEPTYRLPDMAYHIDKINRNYDLIIDIFGSDHFDTYKEVLYGVQSAGYNTDNIKVIIHQMVTFKRGNESFKMSKRSDNVYYLDDLIEDVGIDATQFFFIMRAANTHLDFDIELAKEQSEKNPVYYLQYAYARICGILRNADENFKDFNNLELKDINLDLINDVYEINLLKTLTKFPEEVIDSARTLEPHKLIGYLNNIAESFHKFYHNNRVVIPDSQQLSYARLFICKAVKKILNTGFNIIGIKSPERM